MEPDSGPGGNESLRDQWYGDGGDLLKWGTLVHIAQRDNLAAILHVALYRPDDEWATVNSSRGAVEIPGEVLRHFRNLDNVHRLSKSSGIRIEVFKAPFKDRSTYFEKVKRRIESYREVPLAVFLDPDTGLAPDIPGPEHVTEDELRLVYDVMKSGDVLVCYQRSRRLKGWRGDRRRAFTLALGVSSQDVEVFDSELARDGVLFSVTRSQPDDGGESGDSTSSPPHRTTE